MDWSHSLNFVYCRLHRNVQLIVRNLLLQAILRKFFKNLNENDFLPQKKKGEITRIISLSAPYTISITTLQETKLNISKTDNAEITELINQTVSIGQEFNFDFTSTINFEFWSSSQVTVKLNATSIDNYLKNGDFAIRGSYEVQKSQLYLSFYKR